MESKHNALAMSSLMSPPEATPYERFSQGSPTPTMDAQSKPTFAAPQQHFLSPPVSPETLTTHPDVVSPLPSTVRDPILYPTTDLSATDLSALEPPLFALPTRAVDAIIDTHISSRARRKQLFRESSPPKRDEYLLALEFRSHVMRMYNADRAAWMSRERAFLVEGQRARAKAGQALMPAKKLYAALAPSPTGVQKRTPVRPVVRPLKVRREREWETKAGSPEAGGRSRNTGTSTREDKDFEALPDRCPPLDSLPQRANSLKVEWKGAPLDLSRDPHRGLLHPDEVLLASNLRLDCATYLTSKRRIFLARLECYLGTWGGGKGKKEFRKTDAQQACKIDVNKASKLWMAFERVGWLEERWCSAWV